MVVERVLLVPELAVEVPLPPQLAAATVVGVDVDHAAVEQAGQGRVPGRLVDGRVGAVAVDQRGRGPVERGVPVPQQGRRDRGAVRGREGTALAHVPLRVVAGRLLVPDPVQQPGLEVHRGGYTRLQPGLLEHRDRAGVVPRRAEQVGLHLAEPVPARQVVVGDLDELARPVLADGEQHARREGVRAQQPLLPALGTHLDPGRRVLVGAVRHRRDHQAGLDGSVVGHHQQVLGAVGSAPVLGVVAHPVAAAADGPGAAAHVVGVDDPALRRRVALAPQHDPVTAPGAAHLHLEPLVGLLDHEHVVGDRAADPVPPHLERPVRLVVHRVEEPRRVGAPGAAVVAARHELVEVGAGAQVAEPQLVDLVAVAVDRPGQQVLVRADDGHAQLEEVGPVGERGDVESDLGLAGPAVHGHPDQVGVLAPRRDAGGVREPPAPPPRRGLRGRDPRDHLGRQLRDQRAQVRAGRVVERPLQGQVVEQRVASGGHPLVRVRTRHPVLDVLEGGLRCRRRGLGHAGQGTPISSQDRSRTPDSVSKVLQYRRFPRFARPVPPGMARDVVVTR